MFDFGDDEIFFLAMAVLASVLGFITYYRPLISVARLGKSPLRPRILTFLPLVAMVPTYVVLTHWADPQVVGHGNYIALFLIGGLAWFFAGTWIIQCLGISLRDDVIERDNPAALIAACGFLIGIGVVYAASNIGTGPTIWTTLVPALVATGAFILILMGLGLCAKSVMEAITIDRDIASAVRWAATALACAIVLGYAASGNWVSYRQTWIDLALDGWPAALLAVLAGLVHTVLRPTPDRPRPDVFTSGIIPALLIVLAAVITVVSIQILSRHTP